LGGAMIFSNAHVGDYFSAGLALLGWSFGWGLIGLGVDSGHCYCQLWQSTG